MFKLLILTFSLLFLSAAVVAQNTGAVFGPVVNDGHRSFQYRIGIDPETASGETGYAQRIHYQHSLNGDFMWRLIGQTKKTDESNTDFDFIQAELFWELEGSKDYKTGMRFDLRYRDQNRPHQVGVNWTNEFNFDGNWYGRFVLLTSAQFGDNASDAVSIDTRFNFAKKYDFGEVGVELFNSYGSTEKILDWDQQRHSIGPYLSKKVGKKGWAIFAGALLGLTDAAADVEFKFWVSKPL